MELNHIFVASYIVIALYGLLNIFGIFAPLQRKSMDKYTNESVHTWLRLNGFVSILLAVSMAAFDAYLWRGIGNQVLFIGGLVGILIACVLALVFMRKLVKN